MPKPNSEIVRFEISVPRLATPAMEDMKAALDELENLVRQKAAEAMVGGAAMLEPFLRSQRVTDEIKRHQDVIEQRKFGYFFNDWGCLVCSTKDAPHSALGMCRKCYERVIGRMQTTLRRANKNRPRDDGQVLDLESVAREAIMPAIAALKPRSRRQR